MQEHNHHRTNTRHGWKRTAASGRPMSAMAAVTLCLVVSAAAAFGSAGQSTAQTLDQAQAQDAEPRDRGHDPIRVLIRQIDSLNAQMDELRMRLADAELRASTAERELAELRQFLIDNDQYGQDFEQYRRVREIHEQEARQREVQRIREQREAEAEERRQRMLEARAARAEQRELDDLRRTYERAGFTHLSQGVLIGRMSYNYAEVDQTTSRLRYVQGLGYYQRHYPQRGFDYSRMTISGSIVNATPEVRHLGVAIAFFDAHGNQVGHETIQIHNARPDVPYPFTSTIDMALDRVFSSSTQYVLFADPVELEGDD